MAYKVKKGDTLSQIAKKKGVTLQALLTANPNIKNANQIRVGQSIKMPVTRGSNKAAKEQETVTGNTKSKNPYARMSKTMMNMLRSSDKDKQKTVTKALRREVTSGGAQTSPTPKKARDVKASKDGSKTAMDRARKQRDAAKNSKPVTKPTPKPKRNTKPMTKPTPKPKRNTKPTPKPTSRRKGRK